MREKLALALLVLLGLTVVVAMAWYILLGHNWNHAATQIDDMVGSMDGYVVVLYEGVVEEGKSSSAAKADAKAKPSPGAQPSAASKPSSAPQSSTQAQPSVESQSGAKSKRSASAAKKITSKLAAKSYKAKGASVIRLDLESIGLYDEPGILYRAGKRVALFSVSGKYGDSAFEARRKIRYLARHKPDIVIMIADHSSMFSSKLSGVDVALLAGDAKIAPGGEFKSSMFCVASPERGKVQAVVISPSNFVSTRTLGSL